MAATVRAGLIAASALGGLIAGAAPARAESLADAVALAYQTNPTLAAERVNLRFLEETYIQARAGYRPSANAQISASSSHYGPGSPYYAPGELSNGNALIQLSQPVYTGGRVAAAIQGAEADVRSEREQLRQSEADVLQQVIQAYVNVRRDQQAIAIREENVAVLQRQVDESRTRFNVGEVTRTDVAQSESDLAQARAALATAQGQLAVDRGIYAQVVGQSPGELAPEPGLKLPATLDQAFDRAQLYNPNIRAAVYTLEGSAARIEQAKAARRPSISINGSVGYQAYPAVPVSQSNYYSYTAATATFTQPLFAGGQIESGIRQALERQNYYTIQLEGTRRNTVQNLSQAWNQLLSARANIAADEERVRAAGVAVEGARAEQSVGLRTTLEVLTAEQNLRDAQLELVNARRDEYVASATVLNNTGELAAGNIVADLPAEPNGHSFDRLNKAPGYVPWEGVVKAIDQLTGAPNIKELPPEPDEPIITSAPGQGADTGSHGPSGKVAVTPAPAPTVAANAPVPTATPARP